MIKFFICWYIKLKFILKNGDNLKTSNPKLNLVTMYKLYHLKFLSIIVISFFIISTSHFIKNSTLNFMYFLIGIIIIFLLLKSLAEDASEVSILYDVFLEEDETSEKKIEKYNRYIKIYKDKRNIKIPKL